MIESEGASAKEQSSKTSLFPISKEAVTRALRDISENPQAVIEEEWWRIMAKNRKDYLGIKLEELAIAESDEGSPDPDVKNGAAVAHRIIRAQAELTGQNVPFVSRRAYGRYAREEAREWKRLVEEQKVTGIDPNEKFFQGIAKEDKEFEKAVLDQTAYSPHDFEKFCFGVKEVYFPLRRVEEINRLNRKFGVNKE